MQPQQSADGTKLCGEVDALEGRDAIQRDLDRLERWASMKHVQLNKAKCEVTHLGRANPKHEFRLARERMECSPVQKNLEFLVDEKFDANQECVLAA